MDIKPITEDFSAENLTRMLDPFFEEVDKYHVEKNGKKKPNLKAFLDKSLRWQYCAVIFWNLVEVVATVALPILIQHFILVLQNGSSSPLESYYIAFGIFANLVLSFVSYLISSFILKFRCYLIISIALQTAIYRKSLRLSPEQRYKYSNADILNLIQTEIPVAQNMSDWLCIPSATLQIIAQLYLLWDIFKLSFLVPAAVLLILAYSTTLISHSLDKQVSAWREATNSRLSLLKDFIDGIVMVKVIGLEDQYAEKLKKLDLLQLQYLKIFGIKRSIMVSIEDSITVLVAIITFSFYTLTDGVLTPAIIFPSLLLFNITRPLYILNDSISCISQAKKPFSKIEEFLLCEDRKPDRDSTNTNPAIQIRNSSWEYSSSDLKASIIKYRLLIDELYIKESGFYAITGPVGSGKSTLIKALLRNVPHITGNLQINGSVAYCCQEPWLMQGTIEENILFGLSFDNDKLAIAIKSCGLEPDMNSFVNGIKTQIGEKGVNLSGGQKSRIALARAVYSEADIYLFDNSLAACDSKVSQQIFSSLRHVLKNKIVLMVTNASTLLSQMDFIIELENGKLLNIFQAKDGYFWNTKTDEQSQLFLQNLSPSEIIEDEMTSISATKNQIKNADSFVRTEEKQTGSIERSLYKEAVSKAGPYSIIILSLTVIFSVFTSVGSPLWLTFWSINSDPSRSTFFLIGYVILGSLDSLSTGIQLSTFFLKGQKIGSKYHEEAVDSLVSATMLFFNSNPKGRILNRMNNDVSKLEKNASGSFAFLFNYFVIFISSIIVVCVASPYMIVIFVFFALLSYNLFCVFQICFIESNRLLPLSTSKVISVIDQILDGKDTLLAYKQERAFISIADNYMNQSTAVYFTVENLPSWLNFRLMMMSALVSLGIALTGCIRGNHDISLASLIGVALASSKSIQISILYFLLIIANMQGNMNAIERLRYYAKKLPQEKTKGTHQVDKTNWPSEGSIEFDSVQVAYEQRPDHLILNNISLSIKGGEKIGICGRTGCGKSTLASSLFRLVELKSGRIKIDGLDISKLDLKVLRQSLHMIPQDPILFTGTIRSNLNGASSYTDDELWESLDSVGLKDYVASQSEKLDAPVEASGSNLSFGQRQLMCLARALLVKPKILVMDEATASIDKESDERIQSIIQIHFSNATVLSIAHRLESISGCDKVLVLDQGKVIQFNSPSFLE